MGKGKVISDSSKVNSVQSANSGLLVKSGTFSELQLLILAAKEGDVIRLTQDYKYDTNFLLEFLLIKILLLMVMAILLTEEAKPGFLILTMENISNTIKLY